MLFFLVRLFIAAAIAQCHLCGRPCAQDAQPRAFWRCAALAQHTESRQTFALHTGSQKHRLNWTYWWRRKKKERKIEKTIFCFLLLIDVLIGFISQTLMPHRNKFSIAFNEDIEDGNEWPGQPCGPGGSQRLRGHGGNVFEGQREIFCVKAGNNWQLMWKTFVKEGN